MVDDPALEINFYIQLGEAFYTLGNEAKKEYYFTKAESLVRQAQKKMKYLLLVLAVLTVSCKSKLPKAEKKGHGPIGIARCRYYPSERKLF